MSQAVARAYVDLLRRSEDVPEHVIAGIFASRAEAVPPLLELLADTSTDAPDHPANGMARAHAADLLGELGDRAAVEPLLDAMVAGRDKGLLVKACAQALAKIGQVSEAALARARSTSVLPEKMVLAMVVANAGERSPAARALLEELLPQEPDLVVKMIATYGDRALAKPVGDLLLASREHPRRVIACVECLAVLGVTTPKLTELANRALQVDMLTLGQKMLDDLAPDLELLKA